MNRIVVLIVFLSGLFNHVLSNDLGSFLANRLDITYEKVQIPKGFKEAYKLKIKQPLDHTDSTKGYFYQTVYMFHRKQNAPTVIATEGYQCNSARVYETTTLLKANQIQVEHRYFGESLPPNTDFKYLNLKQATADLHRINQLFREFYKSSWASTGISKGGQTSIFYKYFYPDDVDASIPLVAPFNLSLEDERIYHFFDTIGTKECRDKITDVQERVFMARDTVLPILKSIAKESNYSFTYITLEEAFEYAVLEYPFSFWQWGYDCNTIPEKGEDIGEFVKHLFKVIDLGFYGDVSMAIYGSHYYQAATEMGYYGYEIEDFKEYLKALPTTKNPLATFPPNKIETSFNDSLVKDAYAWLQNKGNNIIYIYGGNDTWSATAIPPSDKGQFTLVYS